MKSGYVALLGRPNVGKSTLLNQLLGKKIAAVSDKPQTTRQRILGIQHKQDAQIIYLDTPGLHRLKKPLNQNMLKTALAVLDDADVLVLIHP